MALISARSPRPQMSAFFFFFFFSRKPGVFQRSTAAAAGGRRAAEAKTCTLCKVCQRWRCVHERWRRRARPLKIRPIMQPDKRLALQKPTANLLIITYLQIPRGRRACKNTFDIVHSETGVVFFFPPLSARCGEVSLRLPPQVPRQHVCCLRHGPNTAHGRGA